MTCCKVMILIFSFLLNNTFKWKNNFPILVSSFRGLIFTITSVTARNSTFSKLCSVFSVHSLGHIPWIWMYFITKIVLCNKGFYLFLQRYIPLSSSCLGFLPSALFLALAPAFAPPLHPQCFSHYNLWSEWQPHYCH